MILSSSVFYRLTFLFALLASLSSMTGCSSSEEPEPEPAEIATTEAPLIDAPEEDLFYAAKRLFAEGHYLIASENFQSLKDGFPLGPYTEFAEIKLADIDFLMNEHAEAAARYEEALKSRPISPAVPYLLLQAARSNQLVNSAIGRDRAPLEKAVKLYNELIEKHPTSMYVPSAIYYRDQTLSRIAHHEQMIADFYQRQGAEKAYLAREDEIQAQWAKHKGSEEALDARWSPAKPQPKTSVQTVALAAQAPQVKTPSSSTEQAPRAATTTATVRVREALCEARNGERITLYFNRQPKDLSQVTSLGKIAPSNGQLMVQLPFELGNEFQADCFAKNDLSIQKSGVITLSSNRKAQAVDLMNPPRLVLFLN